MKIKRFVECLLPVTACNLRCNYCYIIQRQKNSGMMPQMKYSIEQMERSLTQQRLGGICYFSVCGAGETMLPEIIVDIVAVLLKNGHIVNITTNGTLTYRFEQLLHRLTQEESKRLHFSFSLHYLELLRLNKLECFAQNVHLVKNAGCSYLIQVNLCDEYIPYLQEIKEYSLKNFGAYPQLAATRKENDLSSDVELFTNYTQQEYKKIGEQFESPLFDFTMKNFNVKRGEFCYAGEWSFTLNLATGIMKRCYASNKGYDIFRNPSKPIPFCAIGNHCRSLFCMNSSHFMSMGVIPSVEAPTYAQLRDRITTDGSHWYSDEMIEYLSGKLESMNKKEVNRVKIALREAEDQAYGILAKLYARIKK